MKRLKESPSGLLFLIGGLVAGFAAAAYLCFVVPVIPADAQGVGFFGTAATGTRTSCSSTTLTNAVAGQTWCFDQSTRKMMAFDGYQFVPVTLDGNFATQTTILGMSDYVNYGLVFPVVGKTQQVGLHLGITGSNTATAPNFLRIPLLVTATTCNGCGGATVDSVEGMNITVVQAAPDPPALVTGLEISFDNNRADDPINGTPNFPHYGLTVDNYGFRTGPAALRIGGGITINGGQWWRGLWAPLGSISTGSVANTGYVLAYDGDGTGPGCPAACQSAVLIDSLGLITASSFTTTNGNITMTGGGNFVLWSGTQSKLIDNTGLGQLLYVGGANGQAFFDHAGNTNLVNISNTGTVTLTNSLSFGATQTLWNGLSTGAPVCANNCGTNPTVKGTNTAMRVTMGATGTPRSPFLVLFNGTWNATPACIAQLQTATTTTATAVNVTTTGVQVNTIVGPAQGDVYAIHCMGT